MRTNAFDVYEHHSAAQPVHPRIYPRKLKQQFENFCNLYILPQGGGGGTLILSYMHTQARAILFGFNFWISIFFGVFRKMNIFGSKKVLWIFIWGPHKIWLVLGVISVHFWRIFLRSRYRMWIYFLGLLKFRIYSLGFLIFLIFFW